MGAARLVAIALTISFLTSFTFPLAAWAGPGAQLHVSARVVNQCTIRLPDRVPDHVSDRLEDLGRHFEHTCQVPVPVRVGARPGRVDPHSDRFVPVGIGRRAVRPDRVMVTITY